MVFNDFKIIASITSIILFFFFTGCTGIREFRENNIIRDTCEEEWLTPSKIAPEWVPKTPDDTESLKFFNGSAGEYKNEKDAKEFALKNAVNSVALHCGIEIKVDSTKITEGEGTGSTGIDPNISIEIQESQRIDAFVRRIKPIGWATKKVICQDHKGNTKTSIKAYVLVSVPKDEFEKVQKETRQRNEQQKKEASVKKEREADLRNAYKHNRAAYADLEQGHLYTSLSGFAMANELFSQIPRDHHFKILCEQFGREYNDFSCEDFNLQTKRALESIFFEKIGGDQKYVLGKGDPSPLMTRVVFRHKESAVPLQKVLIEFQDDKGNLLKPVTTDVNGIASYQPQDINHPGRYRFQAVFELDKEYIDAGVKESIPFTVKARSKKNWIIRNWWWELPVIAGIVYLLLPKPEPEETHNDVIINW